MPNGSPWILSNPKFVSREEHEKRKAEERKKAAEALSEQKPQKKSRGLGPLGSAIKASAGILEDVGGGIKGAGEATMKGLETFGNQTQSVPAALFTRGQVQDGQYTTRRNIIGNPFSNIQSHISAQQKAGFDTGGNPIVAGIKAANRAGRAFNEDPDISAGVKFASNVGFDPSTYSPALISKLPRIGGALAKSKALRGANELTKGFDNPATAAKFIVGGAVGTEAASRFDVPGVNEGVEQFVGGLGGGIAGARIGAKRPGVANKLTETTYPEERMYHNTPSVFEGPIKISPDGDIGPGHYMLKHPSDDYLEGDSDSYRSTYWLGMEDQIPPRETPGTTAKYRPKRPLNLIVANEPLEPREQFRLKQAIGELPSGAEYEIAKKVFRNYVRVHGAQKAIDDWSAAGWDGMQDTKNAYGAGQIAVWKPNEVLDVDFTPGFNEEEMLAERARQKDKEHGQAYAKTFGAHSPISGKIETNVAALQPKKALDAYGLTDEQGKQFEYWLDPANIQDVPQAIAAGEITYADFAEYIKKAYDPDTGDFNSSQFIDDWLIEQKNKPKKPVSDYGWPLPKIDSGVPKLDQVTASGMPYSYNSVTGSLSLPGVPSTGVYHLDDGSYRWISDDLKKVITSTSLPDLAQKVANHLKPESDNSVIDNILSKLKNFEDEEPIKPLNEFEQAMQKWESEDPFGSAGINSTSLLADFEKVGGQLGSNPGGQYMKDGKKYYVKNYSNLDQAKTEIAGQKIYEAAGIKVPKSRILADDALVTPWEDIQRLSPNELKAELLKDPEYAGRLYGAALASQNWDHVGLEFDNMVLGPNGKLTVIDHGGAFTFRAQGAPKKYTTTPDEFENFKNPDIAPQVAKVFEPLLDMPAFKSGVKNALNSIYNQVENIEIPGVKFGEVQNKIDNLWDHFVVKPPVYSRFTPKDYATASSEAPPVPASTKTKIDLAFDPTNSKWRKPEPISQAGIDLKAQYPMGPGSSKYIPPNEVGKPPTKLSPFNSPEISGGAPGETLVRPQEPGFGLNRGEKLGNVLTSIKSFLVGHGVKNNEVATPIANEYLRINNIVKTQATALGRLAQRAEKVLELDDAFNTDVTKASPEGQRIIDQLQFRMQSFDETLAEFGVEDFQDIRSFADEVRGEAGNEKLKYSDILTRYGNSVANKISDAWLGQQIKKIGEGLDVAEEAGNRIPTKTVNVAGAGNVKLPPEIADVLQKAVRTVHPVQSPEAFQLFQAVNNTLRGLWASMDASFIGIQQLPTMADNPALSGQVMKATYDVMRNPTAFGKFLTEHDRAAYGNPNKLTSTDWIAHELHIAGDVGQGTDLGGLPQRVQELPGVGRILKGSNRMFTDAGNFNRLALADYIWENYKLGGTKMLRGLTDKVNNIRVKEGMTDDQVKTAIARAVNRSTGYASKGFGGPVGSSLFFAPRFMQSQMETIFKAVASRDIEGQIARRQMMKLTGMGIAMTYAINELNGEETIFDPRDSNFLRIKNVGGADISIFGPWDSLIRGLVRSAPQIDENGDFTLGDSGYLVRSKLSPVLSVALDYTKGENVLGQEVDFDIPDNRKSIFKDAKNLRNLIAPFGLRRIGEEAPLSSGLGLLGVKSSPLTNSENLENTLERAGIKKSDPEYLIKRKEYLAAHPDLVKKSDDKKFARAQEVTKDITDRRTLNADAVKSGELTLVEFRENRKKLLTEMRLRKDEILGEYNKKPNTKQEKWLDSYFDLLDNALDPITNEVDGDAFDKLYTGWLQENGTEADTFISRYFGAGLNEVERAYHNDLRFLQSEGYFDMPRYRGMKSGLSDDALDSYKARVLQVRIADPQLQRQSFAKTAESVLGGELSREELLDVIRANSEKFQSPELTKFKNTHRKQLMWFNPNATWETYNTAKPRVTGNKSSLKISLPKLGVAN